jgi:hypothetical protein
MVKLIGPLQSTEARGRVDTLVYNTWRGIRFARQHITPVFKTPDCRTAQMARVRAACSAWKALTDAQRHSWHVYAQSHPRQDWTGVALRISGFNAFTSCYVICSRAGHTPLSVSPSTPLPYAVRSFSASMVGDYIDIAWTYPTQPTAHTYYLQILRTGPISLGKLPDSHHASILVHRPLNLTPYTDMVTLDGRYGYWGRVVDGNTGQISPALTSYCDFTAPAP